MNRDLVLSLVGAAAIHGGVLFGFSRGAPPAVAPRTEPEKVIIVVPPPVPEEVDPIITDDPEPKNPVKNIVPQQQEPITTALPGDFLMKRIATPTIEGPPITQIPIDIRNGGSGEPGPRFYRPIDLDRTPHTRVQISPVYPLDAKQRGIQGTVQIEFTVDEAGRVSEPRIIDSPDRVFNEPTIAAVLKWRFEPGMRRGTAVRFRMIAPVVFSLND